MHTTLNFKPGKGTNLSFYKTMTIPVEWEVGTFRKEKKKYYVIWNEILQADRIINTGVRWEL